MEGDSKEIFIYRNGYGDPAEFSYFRTPVPLTNHDNSEKQSDNPYYMDLQKKFPEFYCGIKNIKETNID